MFSIKMSPIRIVGRAGLDASVVDGSSAISAFQHNIRLCIEREIDFGIGILPQNGPGLIHLSILLFLNCTADNVRYERIQSRTPPTDQRRELFE